MDPKISRRILFISIIFRRLFLSTKKVSTTGLLPQTGTGESYTNSALDVNHLTQDSFNKWTDTGKYDRISTT